MWRAACKQLIASVHPVLRKSQPKPGVDVWQTIGSAFCINHDFNPTFITNAHVVHDGHGNPIKDNSLALVALAPGGAPAGLSVRMFDRELDIAVCEASKEGSVAQPVSFCGVPLLETGTAVASMGFPIPEQPELSPAGGTLIINKRLATGFLSNQGMVAKMVDWPWTDSLLHYELNLLSYPGISGGPVFDIEGRVAGVNRGSRCRTATLLGSEPRCLHHALTCAA
jgi:S1-C subfamily serine protease